jgi:hypothetical protein
MDTPPQDAQSAFPPSTGLALASLLLGIAAVGLSFVLVGVLAGLVGIALGSAYLSKKRGPTGLARWGIGLSSLGIIASVGFGLLYYHYYHLINSGKGGVFSVTTTGPLANPQPLPASNPLLSSHLVWSATVSNAQALCVGDWESDGSVRVLVAAGQTLHVLDLTGAETSTLPLPARFATIECGRSKSAGARLLGYAPWGTVSVVDQAGKLVWSQSRGMGVNGAHWGDLKGDGNDEMIVGMNGFGGLEARSADGKKIWSATLGNVWSQAIVPATAPRPALVLATEAGGSVDLFDASGHRQNTLRPDGGYYVQMTARAIENNAVQILGFSGNAVAAFDTNGTVAWITSAQSYTGNPRVCAVLGDFKGDGAKEWAFMDGAGDLVIATTGGLKVSSIPNQNSIQGFAVATRPGQKALLLTLDAGVVQAYSFGP